MKLLRTIISNYENEFKNQLSEYIVKRFNYKQTKAFQIISENSNLSDSILNKKLAKELYGSRPSFSTYKSFKETFRKVLLKIVCLNDSRGSELQKIAFELQDELNSINKLLYLGLRPAAQTQFKKTLSKALKYQSYEVARSMSLIIIDHYVLYGKQQEQEDALARFRKIDTICKQEKEIKTLYGYLIKQRQLNDEKKLTFKTLIEDIKKQLHFDSYIFYYYYYSIYLIISDESKFEDICLQAIDYYLNLCFNHKAYISIFRNRLLKHKISKGDFVKSKLMLIDLMNSHRLFTYYWYLYALTYVRVLLYSGDTHEAYKWYQKVSSSRNYITLPKDHRNEWEVLGMYVYLMKDEMDSISIRKVKYNLNYNRLERSKNNINFLVAELIYDIKSGKLDIDKKINHLQKIGKDNNRITDFCQTIKSGKKYTPTEKSSFENELVALERLMNLI